MVTVCSIFGDLSITPKIIGVFTQLWHSFNDDGFSCHFTLLIITQVKQDWNFLSLMKIQIGIDFKRIKGKLEGCGKLDKIETLDKIENWTKLKIGQNWKIEHWEKLKIGKKMKNEIA